MKFFPLTKNSIALITVTAIAVGFFAAGLTQTLDYVIIQVLLFSCFGVLVVLAFVHGWRNHKAKNRPDKHQDDLD